jgi:hypothetical protein
MSVELSNIQIHFAVIIKKYQAMHWLYLVLGRIQFHLVSVLLLFWAQTDVSYFYVGFSIIGCILLSCLLGFAFNIYFTKGSSTLTSLESSLLESELSVKEESSLAKNRNIDPKWKIIVPLLTLLSFFTFILAHLSEQAIVDINLRAAGDRLYFTDLYYFSMNNSIHDLLGSGVWEVAVLIALFSGNTFLSFPLPWYRKNMHFIKIISI